MPIKNGTYVDSDDSGGGFWSVSQALPYDVHLSGVPHIVAEVSSQVPDVHFVARLFDIEKGGDATLITRGAFLVREEGKAEFDLYPQDWRLEKGHRLGLFISSADDSWFSPGVTQTEVTVGGGNISIPFLRFARTRFLKGGPAEAMGDRQTDSLESATIKEATVKADLPPRLR